MFKIIKSDRVGVFNVAQGKRVAMIVKMAVTFDLNQQAISKHRVKLAYIQGSKDTYLYNNYYYYY